MKKLNKKGEFLAIMSVVTVLGFLGMAYVGQTFVQKNVDKCDTCAKHGPIPESQLSD